MLPYFLSNFMGYLLVVLSFDFIVTDVLYKQKMLPSFSLKHIKTKQLKMLDACFKPVNRWDNSIFFVFYLKKTFTKFNNS